MNVIFIIYNRPDVTARVFEAIAGAKPDRLLVVADGPKNDEDAVRCEAARSVIKGIDWPCDVCTDFSGTNLGCRRRVTSGLSWAFSNVESAIILEDDCLPHPTFFPFCQELLERYQDNYKISHITGSNLMWEPYESRQSYFISRHGGIWGWATWRRAWALYDDAMANWPKQRRKKVHFERFLTRREARFFEIEWDNMCRGQPTWGYRWIYSSVMNDLYGIVPACNLISNIGFGPSATHTRGHDSSPRCRTTEAITFPLIHPEPVRDLAFEEVYASRVLHKHRSILFRAMRHLRNRHLYGGLISSVPIIGWGYRCLRERLKAMNTRIRSSGRRA